MNVSTITNSIISLFLDFVYPPECISCGKPLKDESRKVCDTCWNAIPIITREHTLYKETRSRLIGDGIIDELVSCYIFENDGPFKNIAHALKYKEYRSCGLELGRQVGLTVKKLNIDIDLIIPVPLHPAKFRERGYNQSELIAQGISSITGKQIDTDSINRIRYTQTQTKLSYDQRRINMANAFKLVKYSSGRIMGKKCLLVDDIITTGATINACAGELIKAGAITIIAASAALAE